MKKIVQLNVVLLVMLFALLETNAQQRDMSENLVNIEEKLNLLASSQLANLNETAHFSVVNTPIQDLLRGIAETHRLNISVSPNIKAHITNNFTNVKVKDLLLFLVKEYKLDIEFINTILSFHPFQEPYVRREYVPKKVNITYDSGNNSLTLDLKQDSLSVFARQLTQHTNKNVIVAPNVPDRMLNGYIAGMPFETALEKIAFANNLEVEKSEDGFYILRSRFRSEGSKEASSASYPNRRQESNSYQPRDVQNLKIRPVYRAYDTLLTIEAVNVPIKDVIQEASFALAKDYIFFSEPQGMTISNLQNISYEELLRFLLHGTTHTYQKQEKVYLVGDRGQEGFRSTRLVRFQFRTIKEVEKVIPVEIAKGVQITPFPELNGIILSGSTARITEIEAFLKAIDQPVPNIMIEVIVMDVRKGTSLQTGISAFIGDSAVQTQGKVFPGMDVTLSSRGINDILDKFETAGVVNLGRVRPNFYATIKALEQNENINVRSTPKLSTLNGHEAELSIGQKVYYLEQTQNVAGGVSPIITTTQNFKSVEANLEIKIVPVVSGDEHITLQISAEFSDFIPPSVENAPPGNATRRFISQIRVRNEEMIVLGGLEEARKDRSNSGFPILSRIPVLKWIFSQRITNKRDDRLVVFIRPTIIY